MSEEKMSADEIRYAIEHLQLERCNITAQIDSAKRSFASGGAPADHKWLTAAEKAKRLKGVQIGQLQRQLSEVLKEERAARTSKGAFFGQVFMEVAQKMLPQDVYEQIAAEAISEMNSEQS